MKYRKINNIVGWLTGAFAYIVYLKTMEPTVSFWDCGEFLSCAYKLEVGHSPGAPFFMLLQRFFGLFSGTGALTGQPSHNAAIFINSLSALTSGLTILFLFWTITHMAKKLLAKDVEPTQKQMLLIMGAGLVGALAYTFSDTFWFSAVEAEVYGTSSFFTAITFWAILKWEHVADNKYADRWLVLIAYLIGLSVCVHLLNLLTIPAVAMVYYFRRYKPTRVGSIIAFIVGCLILAFVQFGVIQYIPILASKFDIFFTNSLGLPFDTGSITFLILLCVGLIILLMYAKRKNKYTLHTAVLCIMFIIIGYSSYIIPVIRSRADVPIDMTNPDNALSLEAYVSREQFGQQPLLFGPDYDTQPYKNESTGNMYSQTKKDGKDYYEVVGQKLQPVYHSSDERFFPRIWENNEPSHASFYRQYLGIEKGESPTSADNLSYFFRYQMGWMWWRYFMWNYAGRQNDFEGQGGPKNGNWMSGIKPIDKSLLGLGDIDKMGGGYRDNEARNQLYFLPFILGLLGLIFQFNRDKKNGFVVLTLFFFTGAAIGIYLNMYPLQPRERDYAFAGSTYTFAIWIGLGVLMIEQWLQKSLKGKAAPIVATILCLILVPSLMAKEEWNDHDRSRKTLARATAYNVLESCAPNAILFTFGDNDTYPLWYLQEVEHIRSDVRIINMSLLGIDWYIDQLNYRINDADAVPMLWKKEDYVGDRHNYITYYGDNPQIQKDKYYNLAEICNFFVNPNATLQTNTGQSVNYLPTKNIFISSPDKAQLVNMGLVDVADTNKIDDNVKFQYPKNVLLKDDLAALNIIAACAKNGWKRPIYFDGGLPGDNYEGLGDYLRLEGIVYRLMPYKMNDSLKDPGAQDMGFLDIPKSYNLFMNTYLWGGADKNNVYFDEKNRIMFAPYRMNAARLANNLSAEGKKDMAVKVLDHVMKGITEHSYLYDFTAYYMVEAYYKAGAIDKGQKLAQKLVNNCQEDVNWVFSLNANEQPSMANDVRNDMQLIYMVSHAAQVGNDTTYSNKLMKDLNAMNSRVLPLFQSQ